MAEPTSTVIERLFGEHRTKLHSFFRRRLRTSADAPDLVQEVYLRLLRVSDKEAIRNPLFYLYTVANNLVKEQAALDHRRAFGVDIEEAPHHEALETSPAFDSHLDTARRAERLKEVLAQLRPKCRAALVLRFTHGLSYRAIAVHLGVSPQMAKKYAAQGLSHCQRRMARLA
jgi:RNA polymerase sigma-70 factor (ECF subfamily)